MPETLTIKKMCQHLWSAACQEFVHGLSPNCFNDHPSLIMCSAAIQNKRSIKNVKKQTKQSFVDTHMPVPAAIRAERRHQFILQIKLASVEKNKIKKWDELQKKKKIYIYLHLKKTYKQWSDKYVLMPSLGCFNSYVPTRYL